MIDKYNTMESFIIDNEKLECIANRIRAIGHPQRIAIISLINKNNEVTVSEIQDKIHIDQAVASNHLRILRDQKIVTVTRHGRNKLYSLKNDTLEEVVSYLEE